MTTTVVLGVVPWFPQEYASEFYLIKGVLGVISTILLIVHMSIAWPSVREGGRLGQQLRYLCLLGFSILITGASAEQIAEETLVSYRHLGSITMSCLLIIAMIVSLRDDFRTRASSPSGQVPQL